MHAYLIPALQSSPIAIERLANLIPSDKLDLALQESRFTPREVIAHLAEWEPIMLGRMQRAVQEPGCIVEGIDEGEMAKLHRYDLSEIGEQLALFKTAREKTIVYLRSLNPAQFASTCTHTEKGLMTVDDQANLIVGHDMYHIEQLSQYLA